MFKIDFASLNPEQLTLLAQDKLLAALADWEKTIWQFIQTWLDSSVQTITIKTSGSTGTPKQIAHSKLAMLNSAAMTCKALDLKPGSICLLCLPATKIGGMMMLVRCMVNRMDCYCIKPSTTPLSDLPDNIKIDFAAFTPMQLHQVVDNRDILKKAEDIVNVILGGEDVSHKLMQQVQAMHNRVYLTFGMTETISHIALKRINGKQTDAHFNTLPGIAVSTNENNCLVISAPVLGQPELHTNDIVNLISPIQFDWLGRADNVINSGGIKVHPEVMEQKLKAEIDYPFFIGSVKDEVSGEKIVLAIECKQLNNNEVERLQNLFAQFDKAIRPKKILAIPKFERTENGKIKRKETLRTQQES